MPTLAWATQQDCLQGESEIQKQTTGKYSGTILFYAPSQEKSRPGVLVCTYKPYPRQVEAEGPKAKGTQGHSWLHSSIPGSLCGRTKLSSDFHTCTMASVLNKTYTIQSKKLTLQLNLRFTQKLFISPPCYHTMRNQTLQSISSLYQPFRFSHIHSHFLRSQYLFFEMRSL